MSINKSISVILLTVIQFNSVYSQDLYKGHTSMKGMNNEYVIEYEEHAVTISNKANTHPVYPYYDDPYFLDTKELVKPYPTLELDKKALDEIVNTVFTPEEVEKYDYNSWGNLHFNLVINPRTGKVSEIRSIFMFTINGVRGSRNPILLSIPITKIEELETLIKERIVFDIPQKYRNVNFLNTYFFIF